MKFIFKDFSRNNYIYKPVINIKKSQDKKTNLLNKLRSFLDAEEPKTIKWLVSLWNKQQEAITYKELRDAYLNGGITKKQLEKWQKDYSEFVINKLYPQWQKAIEAAANQRLKSMMDYIQNHGAELVTQLTQEQKNALNAMIQQSIFYDNMTADELSRIMRPCIGLTVPQSKANMNYYNTVKMALIKSGEKEKNAKKKALDKSARYANKQHRYRAMNIARTELAKAYNQGGYLAAKDAQAKGYLGKVKKIWITAADERVCHICGAIDGDEADIDKHFSVGVLIPPAHPSCRCAVAYKEMEADEVLENDFTEAQYDRYFEDIPKMSILNDTLRKYNQYEVNQIANETNKIISKYTDTKSKWSGNIIITEDENYGKQWNCDITTSAETAPHIILHEQLHARSISYFNREIYHEFKNIEEASVQFFAQEISKIENIEIIDSEYDYMTDILRKINRKVNLKDNDFIFARDLFKVPLPERLDWLEALIYNTGVKRNVNVKTLEEVRNLIDLLY